MKKYFFTVLNYVQQIKSAFLMWCLILTTPALKVSGATASPPAVLHGPGALVRLCYD